PEWVVPTVEDAVARIQSLADPQHHHHVSTVARRQIATIADPDGAAAQLRGLILGEPARLADLVSRGDDERVMEHIAEILARAEPGLPLLRSANRAAHTVGAMTERFEVLDKILERNPEPRTLRMMRGQVGRIRETSTEWLPPVRPP